MTEFGQTLRTAREQKGLTVAQIAEQTHLLPQIVEDLEKEDFHRISAPIYGRGFVKLYCEAVGLEPKPLVDEFMAILNGERAPAIRVREVPLPEEPAAAEPPPPPPPPVYTQPELGDTSEPSPAPDEYAAPIQSAPIQSEPIQSAPIQQESILQDPVQTEPPARQYHPDYAQATSSLGPSVNFGRLAILAGGAILILVLVFLGVRALYRVSMGEPVTTPVTAEEAQTAVKEADAKPTAKDVPAKAPAKKEAPAAKAPAKKEAPKKDAPKKDAPKKARTPKSVPPLYID